MQFCRGAPETGCDWYFFNLENEESKEPGSGVMFGKGLEVLDVLEQLGHHCVYHVSSGDSGTVHLHEEPVQGLQILSFVSGIVETLSNTEKWVIVSLKEVNAVHFTYYYKPNRAKFFVKL